MVQLFFRVYRLAWAKKVWLLHLEIRFVPTSDDIAKVGTLWQNWQTMDRYVIIYHYFCHVPTFTVIYTTMVYIQLSSFTIIYHRLPMMVILLVPSTLETYLCMTYKIHTLQKLSRTTFRMNAPILQEVSQFSPMPVAFSK